MQEPVMQEGGDQQIGATLLQAAPPKSFFTFLNLLTLGLLLALLIYPGWPDALRLTTGLVFLAIIAVAAFSRHGSILCRCILPLVIGGICVEAYVLLQSFDATRPLARYFTFAEHYNEIFYAGVATLYAIITALALVKGIEEFDGMRRTIIDEAYKIRSISNLIQYFDDNDDPDTRAAIQDIREKLIRYSANVAAMRDQHLDSENGQIFRSCQRDIARLKPLDENDGYSLQSILAAHVELGTLRSNRISSIGEKIPRYLIAALWLVAAALILPFMAEPLIIDAAQPQTGQIDNPARFGQYFIIFVLGSLNSFLLLMLSDISDPFEGFWKVSVKPFEELRDRLNAGLL